MAGNHLEYRTMLSVGLVLSHAGILFWGGLDKGWEECHKNRKKQREAAQLGITVAQLDELWAKQRREFQKAVAIFYLGVFGLAASMHLVSHLLGAA